MNRYQQIVLYCLQNSLTEEVRSNLMSITKSEWYEVISAADVLYLTPLIATCIERHGIDIPPQIYDSLKTSLKNNTALNLRLLAEFQKIAKALQSKNISFISLKGVYLATSLYKNVGERLIGDIDILVPLANLTDAVNAIEKNAGYRSSCLYELDVAQKGLHHLPVYIKPNAPPLEIHWTLLNPRFQTRLDLQGIWGRSMPVEISGMGVKTLNPNDLLIYLCAHSAYQHMFIGALRSLYDIKLVLEHYSDQFDWTSIKERATAWNLINSVYLTIHLTEQLFDCTIPQSALSSLRPVDFNDILLDAARKRVFENLDVSPTLTAVWSRKTIMQRLVGLWSRIALSRKELSALYKLPPKSNLVNLYYLARVKDLFVSHGRNFVNLLVGNKNLTEFATHDSELINYLNWWDED